MACKHEATVQRVHKRPIQSVKHPITHHRLLLNSGGWPVIIVLILLFFSRSFVFFVCSFLFIHLAECYVYQTACLYFLENWWVGSGVLCLLMLYGLTVWNGVLCTQCIHIFAFVHITFKSQCANAEWCEDLRYGWQGRRHIFHPIAFMWPAQLFSFIKKKEWKMSYRNKTHTIHTVIYNQE